MSFCFSGMDKTVAPGSITMTVANTHPFILLANIIPWETLEEIVLPDLKETTRKSMWYLNRKLKLFFHLTIYISIQKLTHFLKDACHYRYVIMILVSFL